MGPAAVEEDKPRARVERNCVLLFEVLQLVPSIIVGKVEETPAAEGPE